MHCVYVSVKVKYVFFLRIRNWKVIIQIFSFKPGLVHSHSKLQYTTINVKGFTTIIHFKWDVNNLSEDNVYAVRFCMFRYASDTKILTNYIFSDILLYK